MLQNFNVRSCVKVSADPEECRRVLLAPTDYAGGIGHKIDVYFSFFVHGRLEEARLVAAAQRLLHSFPALGGRLDLSSAPALKLEAAAYPISFAEWPSGSAETIVGLRALDPQAMLPLYHPLQIQEAAEGKAPMFSLRVTSLGDNSTIIAASWLHILADGSSIARCMQWLATAYTRLEEGTHLPDPAPERPLWPWHLQAYRDAAAMDEWPTQKREELLDDAANTFPPGNASSASPSPANAHKAACIRIGIAQVAVDALKAEVMTHPAAQGIPWVSSNDVLMGLAWMLRCDASAADRPGQGPAGSESTATIGIDVHRHGLPPELAPAGFLGNFSLASTFACTSAASIQVNPDSRHALLCALALAAVRVRTAVTDMRKPGAVVEQLLHTAARIPGMRHEAGQAIHKPDAVMTNWSQVDHQRVDFGTGPARFTGHFGYRPSPIIILPDAEGYLIVFSGVLPAEVAHLKASPVLPELVPSSTFVAAPF